MLLKHLHTCYRCLYTCKITELPVSISKICNYLQIKIVRNSDLPVTSQLQPNQKGACVFHNNEKYIILRDTETKSVQRFTAAHEIGHILLRHLPSNTITSTQEIEAEYFALCLLMPPCIIAKLKHLTTTELCNICQCPINMYIRYIDMYNKLPTTGRHANVCITKFKIFLEQYNN